MPASLAPKIAVDRAPHAQAHGTNKRRVIILHSTESHDHPGITDIVGILTYLERANLGIHYVVDGEGLIGRGAYHIDLVYHAKGANSIGIGIEMIGRAAWPTKRWLRDPDTRQARKQLAAVAKLIAYISREENIPLKMSTTHGIACHRDFPEGGHWDPGPGFPIGYVLKRARFYKALYAVRRPKVG